MDKLINILKALSDPNRLRAVMALRHFEELCVCEIKGMLGLATGTVSRHMDVLKKARLVKARKDGRWVYYSLSEEFPRRILEWITQGIGDDPQVSRDRAHLAALRAEGTEGKA
uniref:ArsR family transcriptional regulator n=1 Tax=Desulfacinum infernum TaxID=35837 RepID=A0A832A2A2_9BACT